MIAHGLISARRVLVCAGAGGSGKTTIAAALGLIAAEQGKRAAVVTIDPARRLEDALGVRLHGRLERVGLDAPGVLFAMMLEQKPAWDRLIETHAPPPLRERMLENRFYQRFSQDFAGAHAYAAIDTLAALASGPELDLVVVDTPPIAHAVDFLEAPGKILALLEHGGVPRALQLFERIRSGHAEGVARLASSFVHRIESAAGTTALDDAAGFLTGLAEMAPVFAERARAMQALLRGEHLACVLIATPDGRALDEASRFLVETEALGVRTDVLFINRAATPSLAGDDGKSAIDVRRELTMQLGEHAAAFAAASLERYRARAAGERERVARAFEDCAELDVLYLPELDSDIHELAGLGALAERIRGVLKG